MTRLRRRWPVIAWKVPLFLLVLIVTGILELITTITWALYRWADGARDGFDECWRDIEHRLPSWWERR
jgi:uncharacterized membrane protein